jgi:hypothetical protein
MAMPLGAKGDQDSHRRVMMKGETMNGPGRSVRARGTSMDMYTHPLHPSVGHLISTPLSHQGALRLTDAVNANDHVGLVRSRVSPSGDPPPSHHLCGLVAIGGGRALHTRRIGLQRMAETRDGGCVCI